MNMSSEEKFSSPHPKYPFETSNDGTGDDTFRINPQYELIEGVKVEDMTPEQTDEFLRDEIEEWDAIYGSEFTSDTSSRNPLDWKYITTEIHGLSDEIFQIYNKKGPLTNQERILLLSFFQSYELSEARRNNDLAVMYAELVDKEKREDLRKDLNSNRASAYGRASKGIALFHLRQKFSHEESINQALV